MDRAGSFSSPHYYYLQGMQANISHIVPNATQPVWWISPITQQTHADIALITKGSSGALLRQIPDNTSVGGNKRGTAAVDFQNKRSAAAEVAGGNYSFVGGQNSKTLLASSFAYGDTAYALGAGNIAMGANVTAQNSYSSAWGFQSDTYDEYGTHAHASGIAAGASDAQWRDRTQRQQTANATATVMTSDGAGAATATNTIAVPNSCTMRIHAEITARTGAGVSHTWSLDFSVTKQGAGTAAMVGGAGAVAGITTQTDAGAVAWTVTGNVSGAGNNAEITVTGAAATNIIWVAFVRSVEARR
jgi:hypothetical protein